MGGHFKRWGIWNFACCALSLTLGGLGAEASDGDSLFPPHSTVVLLAGLAGDVESENNYSEQLQAWLEIVQASGNAQKVFLLSDNYESIGSLTNSGNKNAQRRLEQPPESPITAHQSPVTVLKAD